MATCQIKICGLTDPAEARDCATAGADAIGLVFHPPSPRHVSLATARAIVAGLPDSVVAVGVFVDQSGNEIAETVRGAGLRTVQLHGPQVPDCTPIRAAGARIVRVLATLALPDPVPLPFDGFLFEVGRGALPGGNGAAWDWRRAGPLMRELGRPCGLAGGLNAANVAEAVHATGAAAVDASSSVERAPGRKDLDAVRCFIRAARDVIVPEIGPVF